MINDGQGFRLGDKLTGGPPPPEGVYVVFLQDWEQVESSTHKPMLKLRWEVAAGQYAGKVLWDQIVVHQQGIFRGCQILDALGRDRDTYYENAGECATDMIRALEDGAKLTVMLQHRQSPNDPERIYGQITMYSRYIPEEHAEVEEGKAPF